MQTQRNTDGAEKLAYNITEAYQALGIPRSALYRLLREGKLESRKVGRRTIIPAESLRRCLKDLPAGTYD